MHVCSMNTIRRYYIHHVATVLWLTRIVIYESTLTQKIICWIFTVEYFSLAFYKHCKFRHTTHVTSFCMLYSREGIFSHLKSFYKHLAPCSSTPGFTFTREKHHTKLTFPLSGKLNFLFCTTYILWSGTVNPDRQSKKNSETIHTCLIKKE